MKNRCRMIIGVALMATPLVATAELVQAGTANILTFRDCIAGETICDSFGPMEQATYGGLPGGLAAEVSQADVAYGEAYGNAQLMDADSIEAGVTAEELYGALIFENEPAGLKDLGFASAAPSDNETGEGTAPLSITAIVEPGDSVWLWAFLQGIVVNGAEVRASVTTSLELATD